MPQTEVEEKKAILLRTTADIMSNALLQLECCVEEWPEYTDDAINFRWLVDRMVKEAKGLGYLGRA